jgi:hypothetical protein
MLSSGAAALAQNTMGLPAKDFWVAPYGSANQTWQNCSPTAPFLTLDQARLQVRAYRASGYNIPHDITVHIAGGEYEVNQTVVFTSDDSGWSGRPIKYVAWNPQGIGAIYDDDVLISGGRRWNNWVLESTTTWCGGSLNIWAGLNLPPVDDVRDVYFKNRRLIRARYPNIPAVCPHTLWTSPDSAPCRYEGQLLVYDVLRDGEHPSPMIKTVVLERVGSAPAWPAGINWSEVEIVANPQWVAPRQRVQRGNIEADRASVEFDITRWFIPGTNNNHWVDLGGVGVYSHTNPASHALRAIHVTGLQEVPNHPRLASLAYLEGARAFLDSHEEWHYTAHDEFWQEPVLRIALCPSESPFNHTVIPVVEQLLVLDEAAFIEFHGIDWAYAHFPFPVQTDGQTPGYATMQAGQQWRNPSPLKDRPDILGGAIEFRGAQSCRLVDCRIAHTGGTAVRIGTKVTGTPAAHIESNLNMLLRCEIFDVGGHGIYIGDHFTEQSVWGPGGTSSPEPSTMNDVLQCKIHQFGLVYKDAVGINLMHSRDSFIWRNEIVWGNWVGIHIGNVGRSAVQDLSFNSSCIYTHNSEGTRVEQNKIHRVCMGLIDCGGIYVAGSHIPSAHSPSTLYANYIVSMQPSPYSNLTHAVNGMYWDRGGNEWFVSRNFVRNVYRLFHFNMQSGSASGSPNPSAAFGLPASPVAWTQTCSGKTRTWPGQYYSTGNDFVNRWFFPQVGTPWGNNYYKRFHQLEQCHGWALLLPGGLSTASNYVVQGMDTISHQIVAEAGPESPALWFPGTGEEVLSNLVDDELIMRRTSRS